MKKILCIIDTLGMGGAERQMIGLASLLKQKEYYVDLVTYYEHDFYAELVNRYHLGTMTIHNRGGKLSKICALKKLISCGGYDWVIAYKDGPAIICCILKLFGGNFNLIVSERNTTHKISIRDIIKFFIYRWATFVVPNAYSQTDFIKKNFYALNRKTITITNFTDTDLFHPEFFSENNKISILTVARIARQKNILNYLDAIKILNEKGFADDVHFDWYGDVQSGEESYGECCFKKRNELGLEGIIDFHPATTNIEKIFQQCDIFCLPSIYEGFPNVICEAMSSGKPIMCSRICDNPLIVQENVNGVFFDPKDVNSIFEAMLQMIKMPNEKQIEWGKKSREISVSLFSKDAFVQKYVDLIENVDKYEK